MVKIQGHHPQLLLIVADMEQMQILKAEFFAAGGHTGAAIGHGQAKTNGLPIAALYCLAAKAIVQALAGFGALQGFRQPRLRHQVHALALKINQAHAARLCGHNGHDFTEKTLRRRFNRGGLV